MRRCFVDNADNTKKFWIIDWDKNELYTIYGEAGQNANYRSSKFDNDEECFEAVEKKVAGRLKKKEVEVDNYTNYSCRVGVKNHHTKPLYHPNFTGHFTNDIYYKKSLAFAPFDKSIGIDVLEYAQSELYTSNYKGENYDFNSLPKFLLENIWKYSDGYVNPLAENDYYNLDFETVYVSLVTTYCTAFTQIRTTGKLDKYAKQKALMAIRILPNYADETTLNKTLEKVLKPMYTDLSSFLATGETEEDIRNIEEFTGEKISFDTLIGSLIDAPEDSLIDSLLGSNIAKNKKFLNKSTYENSFFENMFTEQNDIKIVNIGEVDFPTGEVIIADPIAYLGTEHQTILQKTIPIGSYETILSIGEFPSVGVRVVGAKLMISDNKPTKFELAEEKNNAVTEEEKEEVLSIIGVDTGLCSFADVKSGEAYFKFRSDWHKGNKDKNIYSDYFEDKFSDYGKHYINKENIKNSRHDFLLWTVEYTELSVAMFASGLGDGIYSAYLGYDENNDICQIVVPFINHDFFR